MTAAPQMQAYEIAYKSAWDAIEPPLAHRRPPKAEPARSLSYVLEYPGWHTTTDASRVLRQSRVSVGAALRRAWAKGLLERRHYGYDGAWEYRAIEKRGDE